MLQPEVLGHFDVLILGVALPLVEGLLSLPIWIARGSFVTGAVASVCEGGSPTRGALAEGLGIPKSAIPIRLPFNLTLAWEESSAPLRGVSFSDSLGVMGSSAHMLSVRGTVSLA